MKISAIVIAKNEEKNITRCIKSLEEIADEIFVLLDSSSTDKTEEIIKSFPNVKFEKKEWLGFAGAKEYALTKINNNWVFWIDADEEVTPELSNEIKSMKKSGFTCDGYSVARRAYFLGRWIKHSGWYPGRVVRLFNKEKVTIKKNLVHEGLSINGKVCMLKNDLNHYTDPNIHHYFEKYNNYTTLAAEELFEKRKNFSIWDLILRPPLLFLKMYFFKLGFLDGIQGFILAFFSSSYVFTKYAKLWEKFEINSD